MPVRIGFRFSLAILLVAAAIASPASGSFSALAGRMRAAANPRAAIDLAMADAAASRDPDISQLWKSRSPTSPSDLETLRKQLQAAVELRALPEKEAPSADAAGAAKAIKSSPLYSDPGVAEGTNWLGNALDRLKNLHLNLKPPKFEPPKTPLLGRWAIFLLWGLLAAAVIFLVYLGTRHLEWKRRLGRRSKAVLEDDEPERSLDEWLSAADDLAARGEYREAVRALYLACLLRFDEHRVARFDRHETNWEHLYRIRRSEKLPAGLDFTPPTKAFDRIWYGQESEGMPDVDRFRAWYQSVTTSLREVRA